MLMTDQDHPYPRLQLLINGFADWLQHRRALSELRQMDQETVNRMLAICGSRPAI
jgi:uncharacterized protein YjiS (DUF1127 family)